MGCDQVRGALVDGLAMGEADAWPEPLASHLATCQSCRSEWKGLKRTWAALGALPEVGPSDEIRARLSRRVRRELLKESVLTVSRGAPAVPAAVVGVGLSLVLSLLVPYTLLVTACQRLFQGADPDWTPYLLAGAAYGVPLLAGMWILRRGPPGTTLLRLS